MRRFLSRVSLAYLIYLIVAGLGGWISFAAPSALAQWQPAKPVELVLSASPGGSSHAALSLMTQIVSRHQLGSVTFTPVFKPGASGGEAFAYFAKADPNHTLLLASKVFYIAPLKRREWGVDVTLYTPVAAMGADTLGLWVSADNAGINSFADFVKAVKDKASKGERWVIGGTGEDSEDSLIVDFINASYKLDIKYTPYPAGGEVVKMLASRKIDAAINVSIEQKALAAEGKTRPVVFFGPERLSHFPNTPTLVEGGDKIAHELQRTISGPPNMSLEAQLYFAKLFHKIYETPEWRAYRQENGLAGKFMSGPGLVEYWQQQLKVRRNMLAVVDIFKSMNTGSSARVR